MITVYICNSMEDIAAFVRMFPKSCWSDQSPLNIDSSNLRKSLPIALHKTPNTDIVSWTTVHNAGYHLQSNPQSYQLGALKPLLDLTIVFTTFLKHNNAYDKYIDSFDPNCSNNVNLQANKLISQAFYWHVSPESGYYWKALNSKWEKLIKHFDIDPTTVLTNVLDTVKEYK